MKFQKNLIVAAMFGTAAFTLSAPSASAHVICNSEGDCWSTHSTYKYPPDLGVTIYNDRYADKTYRESQWRDEHRTWRDERHDRGYYKGGVWVQF